MNQVQSWTSIVQSKLICSLTFCLAKSQPAIKQNCPIEHIFYSCIAFHPWDRSSNFFKVSSKFTILASILASLESTEAVICLLNWSSWSWMRPTEVIKDPWTEARVVLIALISAFRLGSRSPMPTRGSTAMAKFKTVKAMTIETFILLFLTGFYWFSILLQEKDVWKKSGLLWHNELQKMGHKTRFSSRLNIHLEIFWQKKSPNYDGNWTILKMIF